MMRLVRTYCPRWQFVPTLVGFFSKDFFARRIFPVAMPTTTYYPARIGPTPWGVLLFAACLFLPSLVKGQCYELICNQNVPLKLDDNCEGSVNPYYIISNNWSCQGPMTMEYYDAWGVPVGNIVDGSYLGQTLDVHVTHDWTGLTCWGTVQVVDQKKPNIDIDHVTLNCSEDPSVASVGEPTVSDNCSSVISVTHQDSVIDFGCGYTGFAGYFDPSNWEICLPNTGDGGVDVTGAPDQVLVEGADSSPQASFPPQVTRFKIVIPTEGFVSFDWSSVGSSNFDNEGFYLTINNWCIQLTTDSVQSGSYTTGLLQPGDVLSFEQMSDGDFNAVNTLISNFHFHTLAWQVIHRDWCATDEHGNTRCYTQVVTLNRATLSQVHFPPDRDGISAPMLDCGAAADLSVTGLPFIDEDGDLNTTDDQFEFQSGACMLNHTFEDEVIATCEGSELVLRKWTVVDDCSSDILEHTQLIKLFDVTAPTVTCPPAQVISTDNAGCFGTLNLPQASATDDCSSTVTITPNWNYGTGFGPFDDVAVGTYTVTYEATDACGNTSACFTSVTVEDAVSPTVICDQQTTVSLDGDGQAMMYADAVDDGSYDWCCITSYEIKMESAPDSDYAPTLPVDCDDLGQLLMVTLRVTDCYGNWNTCNVDVIVQDQYDPVILPPADVTVDCTADLSDLSQFGAAQAYDNCGYTLDETVDETSSGCGEGAVIRTWTATDASGNTVSASQTINLANLSPWNLDGNQIAWPPDYETSECGASLEPWELPMPYSGPILGGQNGCESVAVSHTDDYFWVAEPACFKIFRTWKVIDWCQFQANDPNTPGLWEYTQTLEVLDNEAPVFVDPPTNFFVQGNANCTGNVILPLPEVADCSDHLTITSSGELGSGFSFANVAAGTYQMTYTAHDGCGNSTSHSFTVSVGDDQPPTAYCTNGLTVALGADGVVDVSAATFNLGSFDNCSSNLLFCYSPNPNDEMATFTCTEEGQNTVELFVIDEGGNYATCQTFIVVLDNAEICNPTQPDLTISGLLQTPDGQEVAQAEVALVGEPMAPVTTPPNGAFAFANLPAGNDYAITPTKNTGFLNGVTAYDLVKINDHILGAQPFDTPWKIIAADANGSGSVTTADIVAVQHLVLHITDVFPNGTPSWQFIPSDHIFTDPQEPWGFPTSMSMPGLMDDYLDAHFTAVKVGDVTGNADPLFLVGSQQSAVSSLNLTERSMESLFFSADDQHFEAGEVIEVAFRTCEGDVIAWQTTIEFDSEVIDFQEIIKSEEAGHQLAFGKNQAVNGTLTAASFGAANCNFTLRFLAKKPGQLSNHLHLSDTHTPTAAWDSEGKEMDVELYFGAAEKAQTSQSIAHHSTPNPFASQTTLHFDLPQAGKVHIQFLDLSGRVLHVVDGSFAEGKNQVQVTREEFGNVSGLVLYRIESEGEVAVGRMVAQD